MTQVFVRRNNNRIGENSAADNSIIEEITCINFMCHDKLHVQLGPLINFIVGHNGSGKSAVLTAITLCLGGKVASTNRGSSLKSMIKSGKEQAALIIKMKNKGNDAYQPDMFGDSIIIERHFNKSGSSSYKLKNANGKLISSKKGDVDDIIEYYQLQVDNPMNVLTQDAAKSFIQTSTPSQKYVFFHQGVQLEALDNDYKLLSDTCDQIETKLNEAKEGILELKKNAEAAEAKSAVVRQHEGMRRKCKEMTRKLAWAQVFEIEEKLHQKERDVTDHEQQIENSQRRIEEKSEEFEVADRNLELATQAQASLQEGLTPLKDEEEVAKNAHDDAVKQVKAFAVKTKEMKGNLQEAEKKVKDYNGKITEHVRLLEEANGGAHAQKLTELAEAERAAADALAAEKRNKEELPQLEKSRWNAVEACKSLDNPLSMKRREVEIAQERLQSLNRDRGNVMAGFDAKMPRLIQAIKNDRGFLETPVGPMGLHIKLNNPIWSNLLESTMGSNLTGFIVTSKADQVRLSNLLRKERMTFCPIVIGNHHPIDTTGNEPDEQFETILRALDIDNDLVKRQLIITMGIDQSILVKRREEGFRVMYQGPRPRNVRQCFCLHDSERGFGHRLGFTGSGGVHQDITPISPPKHKPRMQTDIESQVSYQRETVTELESQLKALETQKRQLQTTQQKCESALGRHKQESNKLKIAVQRAEQRVDNLRAEADRYQPEDGVVDGLKVSLGEAEQELAICQEAYGNLALERTTLNEASLEKKRELDAVRARVTEYEFSMEKADQKVKNREQARRLVLGEKNQAIHNIEELRASKEIAVRKRDGLVEQVASFVEEAKKICAERVYLEPGETYASLGAAFERLKARVKEAAKRQGGSDDEIHNAALEANRIYDEAKANRGELLGLLGLLKESFMKRMQMYWRFQRYISARSRINFNYLLSERAFRGKLLIDHKAKKLDVQVEPDETTKSSKGRQTKTLSGGEKSFSSICLLLALWEAMGAPMRCLDEFDVFMDDVNRDVSTKLIITGARRSVGRQFILISPKALGAGAADGPDVKIIKLHDPRERQRRIDEMVEED
ncbi:putative structural maintenance of chromosomes protein 6 [Mollisia scopiformis]|uniref:Putative structural maintenance of chromosomes protein 6 n=1 Tax=Mollisia scopiformis TaxID=149040 RepID=A0A194WRJ0_MOLSC|nr:putative structural maintenance of chromosomes protein 6 [Mollisia scopiformis]KUJ10625.1 putative structural maintenance of chromosomes protein 6 [Mollisia scopiformis]